MSLNPPPALTLLRCRTKRTVDHAVTDGRSVTVHEPGTTASRTATPVRMRTTVTHQEGVGGHTAEGVALFDADGWSRYWRGPSGSSGSWDVTTPDWLLSAVVEVERQMAVAGPLPVGPVCVECGYAVRSTGSDRATLRWHHADGSPTPDHEAQVYR